MGGDEGYLLDNARPEAITRFRALAQLFDPPTRRAITELGVAPGWRCWEAGAGSRGVPDWLAEQVGVDGLVVATDIDTAWLDGPGAPALRVLRHDVGAETPPARDLDLVHARLVLTHVPERAQALAHLVSALRPGGWLLLEEADPGLQPLACPDESGPAQELANRLRRGFRTLMADRGADLALGRTLPRLLRAQGLVDVVAEVHFPLAGDACVPLEVATIEHIRERLVEGGVATRSEIDEHLGNVADGRVPDLATAPMVTARGRRP